MELWVAIAIAAAFVQNLRFMLQKQLTGQLSTLGVTFARFVYAVPLVVLLIAGLMLAGQPWPQLTAAFVGFALVGALAQILATALLVSLFSLRNFAVGVTYSKTELVMTAGLSAAVLAEPVGLGALLALLVSVFGVVLLSRPPDATHLFEGLFSKAALIGVSSGLLFSVASVGYRGASLSLGSGDFVIRASVTLAFVTICQTLAMAAWMIWREPGQIAKVWAARRIAGWVGVTGMLGSLGWFTAFTLVNATYVKAVGQIEVVFTVLTSVFIFGEALRRSEVFGIVLIMAGIGILLAVA